MAISKTIRPGLIQLRVVNLEESVAFYRDILGLDVVGQTSDGRVMLKTYDEFDHHSVVLRHAPESGFDYVAFKVVDDKTLEELKEATEAFGYPVDVASDEQPGYGKRYGFTLCTGHRIELYAEVAQAEKIPMLVNPDPWVEMPRSVVKSPFLSTILVPLTKRRPWLLYGLVPAREGHAKQKHEMIMERHKSRTGTNAFLKILCDL